MVELATSRVWKLRLLVVVLIVLLLAILVPPWININQFRRRIVQSIGAGLGRTVHARYVELRLFPQPGFVLHDFIVEEDPAFGVEPVLIAPSVTATLRASTLWHMRVEIAALRFDQPSLNLTRNATGAWNFESILRRSSVPASSAAGSNSQAMSSRPAPFPYVEATQARVNFKIGMEKKPFSLEDADLALWKESGNWHVRLKARPVRTDLTVSDSGQILADGVLNKPATLEGAPINLRIEWRKAELGDVSRLLRGHDDGWRGAVEWIGHARGTLSHALITSDVEVDEVRRAEFIPTEDMNLSAHCQAGYERATRTLEGIQCNTPLGSGQLVIHGAWPLAEAANTSPAPTLHLELQRVPAQFFLDLLRHVHPAIPAGAAISGDLNGAVTCRMPTWARDASPLQACRGEIHSAALTLNLSHLPQPLTLSPFTLSSALVNSVPAPRGSRQAGHRGTGMSASESAATALLASTPEWRLLPANIRLGGTLPATLTGGLKRDGPSLRIAGPVGLKEFAEIAESLNFPAISKEIHSIRGDGQLTVQIETHWLPVQDFSGPNSSGINLSGSNLSGTLAPPSTAWDGSLQLHDATVQLASLAGIVQLSAGNVTFNPRQIQWTNLVGSYGDLPFDGSIQWQLRCTAAATSPSATTCERTFALHTPLLNTAALWSALHPSGDSSSLLALVNPWPGRIPAMPRIQGTVRADTLEAGRLSLRNATLTVTIDGRSAQAASISGELFGGALQGKGSVQWDNQPPSYTLDATLDDMQAASAGDLWHEHWGRGAADLQIALTTQGGEARELAQHAAGRFSLHWQHGGLSAPAFASTPLGGFQTCQLTGKIENQALWLSSGTIGRSTGREYVTGKVTFDRALDLRLRPAGISIEGTVSEPVVHGIRGHKTLHIAERQSGSVAE